MATIAHFTMKATDHGSNLSDDDIAWLREYAGEVRDTFGRQFLDAKSRFKDGERLLKRFEAAIADVEKNGRSRFRGVDEAHNELCVAGALLKDPELISLDYEPRLGGCAKTIDFLVAMKNGTTAFIDVKTIKPEQKDRWEQYERARREKWFPEGVQVIFCKEWLGGELWHNAYVARSRMLEYALELEVKIAECNLQAENRIFVLMLCGEGFYWHVDELEDFVSFYFSKSHRADDPFSIAESKYIEESGVGISRSITRFACLSRRQGDVRERRVIWNLQAPAEPWKG